MRCHDLEIIVLLLHKHHTNTYMQYESLCTNYEIGTNKIYNVFIIYSLYRIIPQLRLLQRIKLYFKNIAAKIAVTKCCKSINATNENIDLILRCKNITIQ